MDAQGKIKFEDFGEIFLGYREFITLHSGVAYSFFSSPFWEKLLLMDRDKDLKFLVLPALD